MEIKDRVVVVTGAAGGIWGALVCVFAEAGAKRVICADLDEAGAEAAAEAVDGIARKVNVARGSDIQALIEETERDVGPIDLFCSNAGILTSGGPEKSDEQWERIWKINLMAHVYAVRHLVPRMAQRGGGKLGRRALRAACLKTLETERRCGGESAAH